MKPNKLPNEVVSLLLPRLQDEMDAFYFYRSASNWCENVGYLNAAKYFANESEDELKHAKKIEKFLTDWNVMPSLPSIDQPELKFKGLCDIFEQAYGIEYALYEDYEKTSKKIFDIGDLCAFDFLQEFRTIQMTSVAEYSTWLNKLELIDESNKFQLYLFEKEEFEG